MAAGATDQATGWRGWFAGRGRSLGAGALVLAALAVGRVVTDQLPDARDVGSAPIERTVQIGEVAHLRIGDVTVVKIQGGKVWSGIAEAKTTPGIWIVADLAFTPSQQDSAISMAAIRDDAGHVWSMGRGTSTCKGVIPGVPMTCQVAVEVPAQTMSGAELVLRWNPYDLRWDDQAIIPLTIDADSVATWSKNEEPITIPLAKVGK